MTVGTRVSAFAKRRRLNNGTSTPSEELLSTAEVTPVASPKALKDDSDSLKDSKPEYKKPRDRRQTKRVVTSEENSEDDNSFAALTKASAVDFGGTREVDVLDARSLKVRLSERQKCSVTGVAELWVREGIVSVYGAVLRESTRSFMLYAPSSHSVPSITALSKSAEIQLEAAHNVQPYFGIGKRNPWHLGVIGDSSVMSFTLLGALDVHDSESAKGPPELDLNDLKGLLYSNQHVGTPMKGPQDRATSSSRPRILLCGRRSGTVSGYTVATINHLLTLVNSKGQLQHPNGVLLLDFDTRIPEFALPNTVSLVHIKEPILGPSFCHPLTPMAHINTIKHAIYIGADTSDETSANIFSDICDLVIQDTKLRTLPLVMKGNQVLDSYRLNQNAYWWDELQPTTVFSVDNVSNTPIGSGAQALAERVGCPFITGVATISRAISQEAELQWYLQSYFHIRDYVADTPVWSRSPVLGGGQNKVVLSYKKDDEQLNFIALSEGFLDPEDLVEALEQSMVFIVTYHRAIEETDDIETSPAHVEWQQLDMDQTAAYSINRLLTRGIGQDRLSCLGLGIVASVSEEQECLSLITPVPHQVLSESSQHGAKLGLLLSKPGADGRLSVEWAFKEMDT